MIEVFETKSHTANYSAGAGKFVATSTGCGTINAETAITKKSIGKVLVSGMMLLALVGLSLSACKKDKDPVDAGKYTVTFDAGGGAPVPPKQTVEAGGMAAEPQTNPEKQDYVFMFWHLSGTSTPYNFQMPVNSNITLVAKWETKANVPYADYFGTWRYIYPNPVCWEQFIISADKIEWTDYWGYYCSISGLTWTETTNPGGDYAADYPAGYKVTGTYGMFGGLSFGITKADGSKNCKKGDIALITFYISADKKSIASRTSSTADQEADHVYNKRTDIEYWQVTHNLNGGEWMADCNFVTKVSKGNGYLPLPGNPVKGDLVFEGWYCNGKRISYMVNEITGNITYDAKWSSETYLQKAVYSMGYSIKIGIERPTSILDKNGATIATITYAGTTLTHASIKGNSTLVPYWADGGRQRPSTISGTANDNTSSGSIRDGTYNYARNSNQIIARFDEYQPNNPYISLSNLQKITNNTAITQTIYDNIRGVLPSYSYKMIVFGINSKKELMGKYIGYTTDGKVYNYWCIDPASSDFGKGIFKMNSPIN